MKVQRLVIEGTSLLVLLKHMYLPILKGTDLQINATVNPEHATSPVPSTATVLNVHRVHLFRMCGTARCICMPHQQQVIDISWCKQVIFPHVVTTGPAWILNPGIYRFGLTGELVGLGPQLCNKPMKMVVVITCDWLEKRFLLWFPRTSRLYHSGN